MLFVKGTNFEGKYSSTKSGNSVILLGKRPKVSRLWCKQRTPDIKVALLDDKYPFNNDQNVTMTTVKDLYCYIINSSNKNTVSIITSVNQHTRQQIHTIVLHSSLSGK